MLFSAGLLLSAALAQDATPAVDSAPRSRVTALPVVSYSDVTGLQYGATVFRSFRVGSDTLTRASSLSAYASRTAKDHDKVYVQLDRWSGRNAARFRIRAEHISYPLPFFGIGPNSPKDAEEWYSSGVSTAQVFMQRLVTHAMYLHAGVRYVRSRLRESETGGMLEQAVIAGSSGSDVLASELGLVIDSRDNVGAPRTGTYARVIPSIASRSFGSDFAFRRLALDARRYHALGKHVVALQMQYDGVAGSTPFDLMPMIGADTAMRGYARGRFRDRHAFTAQGELRTAYWRRIGLVTFAGAGTVAPRFSAISEGPWFPSVGVGLRYALVPKDRTNARLDLGIGRGTFGISVGIGEAF